MVLRQRVLYTYYFCATWAGKIEGVRVGNRLGDPELEIDLLQCMDAYLGKYILICRR